MRPVPGTLSCAVARLHARKVIDVLPRPRVGFLSWSLCFVFVFLSDRFCFRDAPYVKWEINSTPSPSPFVFFVYQSPVFWFKIYSYLSVYFKPWSDTYLDCSLPFDCRPGEFWVRTVESFVEPFSFHVGQLLKNFTYFITLSDLGPESLHITRHLCIYGG